MDRDLLRIVLVIFGVVLVLGIYLWDRFVIRQRKQLEEFPESEYGVESEIPDFSLAPNEQATELSELDLPSLRAESEHEGFDERGLFGEPSNSSNEPNDGKTTTEEFGIIRLAVVAHGDMLFPGKALIEAFKILGLEYGDMKIFHRDYQDSGFPLFSVVNMVEPGTFPIDDLSNFQSPGVALFLQTSQVEQPLEAFDEMVRASHALAARLGGEVLDSNNKPLTVDATEALRKTLRF